MDSSQGSIRMPTRIVLLFEWALRRCFGTLPYTTPVFARAPLTNITEWTTLYNTGATCAKYPHEERVIPQYYCNDTSRIIS